MKPTMEIVSVDLGGTNVRFAIAEVAAGRVTALGPPVTLHTGDYASLTTAWAAYAAQAGRGLPRAAALAVACPITGDGAEADQQPLGAAPGNAGRRARRGRADPGQRFRRGRPCRGAAAGADMRHVAGPDIDLPERGVIGVLGPGTGLGVAQVMRRATGYDVVEAEGGHIDFAPVDTIDDALLATLRARYRPRLGRARGVGPRFGRHLRAAGRDGGRRRCGRQTTGR